MNEQTTCSAPAAGLRSYLSVWGIVFLVYASTMGGHIFSPDGEIMFRTTEAIVTSGALAIEPIPTAFATRTGKDGQEYPQYGIGQPILAIPFYVVGRLWVERLDWSDLLSDFREIAMQYSHDARGRGLRFFVSWFNTFLGAFFATAMFAFVYRLTHETQTAWLTTLLYAFGTMAWPQARTFFSEPLAALGMLFCFLFLHRSLKRNTIRDALWAGLFLGGAVLTRLDTLAMTPGLIVYLVVAHTRQTGARIYGHGAWFGGRGGMERFRTGLVIAIQSQFEATAWKRWLAWGAPIVGAVGIFAAMNLALYGDLTPAYADQAEGLRFATPLLVGLHGFLFSFGKGLFFFSPVLILFFWAIGPFLQREPALGWGVIVSMICFLGVMSKWGNWAGGWCWGPRHIFQIHWMLALPICAFLRSERVFRTWRAYGALMMVSVGVQIYGSSVNFNDYYIQHFQTPRSVPWARALYSEEEVSLQNYFADATGQSARYSMTMTAPINDSVYTYQNSQWPGNARCLRHGMHDNYWLHWFRYRKHTNRIPAGAK